MAFVLLLLCRLPMSSLRTTKRVSPEALLDKRRQTLLTQSRAVRDQFHTVGSLDSSYDACRETLRQWRSQMLDRLHQSHQTSLSELNSTYEQLNRFRSTLGNLLGREDNDRSTTHLPQIESSLHTLRNAQFTFDIDRANHLDGQLQLLKMSNPQPSFRPLNKSTTKCRLLVSRDRHVPSAFFHEEMIVRVDCQTPDCIIVCPFDLLDALTEDDEEIRLLIDQTYLPSIGAQAQRMRIDYDLSLLQPAQECCPQSTERVIKIVPNERTKFLTCLEDIYSICNEQGNRSIKLSLIEAVTHEDRFFSVEIPVFTRGSFLASPTVYNPYDPIHYNRSKLHAYGGYPETFIDTQLSPKVETNQTSDLFSLAMSAGPPTPVAALASSSFPNHFDRVLMPIAIRQTLQITDMQAGALLGPKGERIQQLQRETGAIVNIGDVHDESGERRKRLVSVQGSDHQVNKALQVIRSVLMMDEATSRKDDGKSKRVTN